jgi:hypothetical protein
VLSPWHAVHGEAVRLWNGVMRGGFRGAQHTNIIVLKDDNITKRKRKSINRLLLVIQEKEEGC